MDVYLTEHFKKQVKKLEKKFRHLRQDLIRDLKNLNVEKEISVGRSIYKIRIKSSDLNTGKSGGLRSYIYLFKKKDLLVPLCIYFKGEKGCISKEELNDHFLVSNIELMRYLKSRF